MFYTRVWIPVSHIKGKTQIEGILEQDAYKNIWN
jgi:hypothetical protein